MDMFLITKILDLAYVQNYMRCLSQNKSDTKLFRVYLFTVFTIKRPRALASLAPLGLLIVKTVTNILELLHKPIGGTGASFCTIFNMLHIRDTFFKIKKHEMEKKIQLSDTKFEFAGGVANWYRLGYELSVVNLTTCSCLNSY